MLNETTDQLISTDDFYNPFTLSDMTGDKPRSKKLVKLVEKLSVKMGSDHGFSKN